MEIRFAESRALEEHEAYDGSGGRQGKKTNKKNTTWAWELGRDAEMGGEGYVPITGGGWLVVLILTSSLHTSGTGVHTLHTSSPHKIPWEAALLPGSFP